MKKEVLYSKESIKSRLIGFVFPLLNLFWGYFWNGQILKYINGQCLNKNTFSAFGGKYRRNIFTCAEIELWSGYDHHRRPNVISHQHLGFLAQFWNCCSKKIDKKKSFSFYSLSQLCACILDMMQKVYECIH